MSDGTLGRLATGNWDEEHESERNDDILQLAGFVVGEGTYGIDIMRIKEVLQSRPYPIRKVPHAPAIIEGVIELRGVVIPVIDLRKRFSVEIDHELDRFNKLIIVSVRGRIVGLKVDKVIGELRVPSASVRPAPSMLSGIEGATETFFSGVCKVGDDVVFVLHLDGLLGGGG